jgi:hypothetical protein
MFDGPAHPQPQQNCQGVQMITGACVQVFRINDAFAAARFEYNDKGSAGQRSRGRQKRELTASSAGNPGSL